MSFELYKPKTQGLRSKQPNQISVGKTRIGLGMYHLPYEYVQIHYDKEIPAIMFTKGNKNSGYKVKQSLAGSAEMYLDAKGFTVHGYIPYGTYERAEDARYIFTLIQTRRYKRPDAEVWSTIRNNRRKDDR